MSNKISVIIPCYNQEKYIQETLDSVLLQTFSDYEVIIINDGSTDNSLSILTQYTKQYPQKIKLINQENKGVITARNNGISHASGKYIFPLDGDDKIAHNCLEVLYKAMEEKKGDVICCQTEYFGERQGRLFVKKPNLKNMSVENQVVVSSLYKKSDWEEYGGYDENLKKGLEDWDFWLNFLENQKKFYRVPDTLLFYRILSNSRNRSFDEQIKKDLMHYLYKKHKKIRLYLIFYTLLHKIFNVRISHSQTLSIRILGIPVFRTKNIQILNLYTR